MNNQEVKDEINDYFNNLIAKLRAKDPQFEERIEFGKLLMILRQMSVRDMMN